MTYALSVVVPAYRKEGVVAQALLLMHSVLVLSEIEHEFVIVIDGSPDRTEDEIRALQLPDTRIISYPDNRGKGFALRTGFAACKYPVVAFADADPDIGADSLVSLALLLESTGASAAIGSKTHPLSTVEYPAMRRIQSSAYRRMNRLLFGLSVTDTQTGLKVFRVADVRGIISQCQLDGFAFDLEFLVLLNASKLKIVEGPISLSYDFSSSVPIHAAFAIMRDTIGLWWKRNVSTRRP